jgi:hypothetical protein
MFIRKSLLELGKFASSDAKRLLQQYRPASAAPTVRLRVRFRGLSAAPALWSPRQFMTLIGHRR